MMRQQKELPSASLQWWPEWPPKRYVAACSFGKDSLATIILALKYGEPINEAVYCEVMFDDDISGEAPEHRDFIYEKAIPFLERNGIEVKILRSDITFIRTFYRVLKSGNHVGKLHGWPVCGKCTIQRDCKVSPINAYKKKLGSGVIQYTGIAYDERERLARLDKVTTISLLEKYQKTERDTVDICKYAGLYSPVYEFTSRNGCFFCPNAKRRELRHLYDHHPDLWARLLECQGAPNKVSELFNRSQRFDEIDEQFKYEDLQCSLFDCPSAA